MSEFNLMSLSDIEAEASSYHCGVVIAADNELQFDLDTPKAMSQFREFYSKQLYYRYGDKLPRVNWESKNGNDHVVVTLPEALSVPERIALQLAGGSDPAREFSALCCHWDGSKNPILLFKPKEKMVVPQAASSYVEFDVDVL